MTDFSNFEISDDGAELNERLRLFGDALVLVGSLAILGCRVQIETRYRDVASETPHQDIGLPAGDSSLLTPR